MSTSTLLYVLGSLLWPLLFLGYALLAFVTEAVEHLVHGASHHRDEPAH